MTDPIRDHPWDWKHVTESTLVKTGGGALHTVTVNHLNSAVVTIFDGVDATGSVIADSIQLVAGLPVTLTYDLAITTGIFVQVVADQGSADLTVTYI